MEYADYALWIQNVPHFPECELQEGSECICDDFLGRFEETDYE